MYGDLLFCFYPVEHLPGEEIDGPFFHLKDTGVSCTTKQTVQYAEYKWLQFKPRSSVPMCIEDLTCNIFMLGNALVTKKALT